MKDLLSTEHYCYKIVTSLMENSVPPFYRQTSYMDYSCPILQENPNSIPIIFCKSPPQI